MEQIQQVLGLAPTIDRTTTSSEFIGNEHLVMANRLQLKTFKRRFICALYSSRRDLRPIRMLIMRKVGDALRLRPTTTFAETNSRRN